MEYDTNWIVGYKPSDMEKLIKEKFGPDVKSYLSIHGNQRFYKFNTLKRFNFFLVHDEEKDEYIYNEVIYSKSEFLRLLNLLSFE